MFPTMAETLLHVAAYMLAGVPASSATGLFMLSNLHEVMFSCGGVADSHVMMTAFSGSRPGTPRPKAGRRTSASSVDPPSELSNAGQFLINTAETELKKALTSLSQQHFEAFSAC